MLRVSSDWTLFYKIFLPTVWIVFFAVVTGVFLFSFHPSLPFIIGALLFYGSGVLLLYVTLMPLKRVEGNDEHLYVTNYFKTYRYTFDAVQKISHVNFIIFTIAFLHFKEKSSFGIRPYFIRRKGVWEEYLLAHSELKHMSDLA